MPFAVVHSTLGAVAAGELEEAFERLLPELRRSGIKRAALYAAEGELHRIAGEPPDPSSARRLTLYDGYDVVGELQLEVDGTEPVALMELLQDVFGLGIGRRVRMRQLDLVNAAVAVNSAESLDEALDAVAEACRRLASAPNAFVIVWHPDTSRGVVRAAAGDALLSVGEEVLPGKHVSYLAAASGRVSLKHTGEEDGLGPHLRETLRRYGCAMAVPLVVEGAPPITFQIAWPVEPTPADLERTIVTVQRLGALTSVAFRAADERSRAAHSELLKSVIETVPDGIIIRDGTTETLNAAARTMLCVEGDTLDRTLLALRRLDGTPLPLSELPSAVCIRTGRAVRSRLLATIRGEERVFDVKAAPMTGGFVLLLRDVTEEHVEHVLTQEFLTRLFETLPLAAVVLDEGSGELLQTNTTFEKLLGYAPDELAGTHPPHAWCDTLDRLTGAPERRLLDAVYRRKDGHPVPVELLRFTVPAPRGEASRMVVLAHDITERREFDRRLIESGKLAAIGELAAGVAHEINNPLFAILGLVEFLIRDAEEGSKAHERLLLIQQTGLEIKEIVKALLDFARERTDDHRPMELRDVAAETLELIRRTSAVKDVAIEECYSDGPTPTVGSPNQIKQVLLNLVTNALHALHDGGGTVTVTIDSEDSWVLARVADDGPGIPPGVVERIFEPFFTTRRDAGGTGLGLAVSHGIAEMHGGSLSAESRSGEGAVFTLRLPRSEEEPA